MPYLQVINSMASTTVTERRFLLQEFALLRAELDDIRSAVSAIRALLVAGTAVGAGYNVAGTNIGAAITATPGQTPRFTPT